MKKYGVSNAQLSFKQYLALDMVQAKIRQDDLFTQAYQQRITRKADLIEALVLTKALAKAEQPNHLMPFIGRIDYDLDYMGFIHHDKVKKYLTYQSHSLLTASDFKNTSQEYFYEHVLPKYQTKASKELVEQVRHENSAFSLRGEHFSAGVDSYRAALVVPLAMVISLIMIVFTLIRTISMGLNEYFNHSIKGLYVGVAVSITVCVLAFPLLSQSSLPVSQAQGDITSYLWTWFALTQEAVYFIGKSLP